MAYKVLADANVCLDLLLDRRPHVEFSGRIFELAEQKEIELFISGLSFDTLFYIMRPELSAQKAVEKLRLLLKHVKVAPMGQKTVESALDAEWNDLEDALQYFSAVESGCDCIVTRNGDDFKSGYRTLKIFDPEEFVEVHLHNI